MAQTRSRRCSPCGIDWPNIDDCRVCPDCGADTWNNSDKPDKTIAEAREAVRNRPDSALRDTMELPTCSAAYGNRLDRYLHLGFTEVDAHALSCAKDAAGFYVYHGDVAKHLQQGCTHAQAVAVFA